MRVRSHYDREILGLAAPAIGALAAEPLYLWRCSRLRSTSASSAYGRASSG
jgi:hypothetical protein